MARRKNQTAPAASIEDTSAETQAQAAADEAAALVVDTQEEVLLDEAPQTMDPVDEIALRRELKEVQDRAAEIKQLLASKQTVELTMSAIASPLKVFRSMFVEEYPQGTRRKDVVARGVAAGISPNTCKTQYQILKGKAERGELAELLEEVEEES